MVFELALKISIRISFGMVAKLNMVWVAVEMVEVKVKLAVVVLDDLTLGEGYVSLPDQSNHGA